MVGLLGAASDYAELLVDRDPLNLLRLLAPGISRPRQCSAPTAETAHCLMNAPWDV